MLPVWRQKQRWGGAQQGAQAHSGGGDTLLLWAKGLCAAQVCLGRAGSSCPGRAEQHQAPRQRRRPLAAPPLAAALKPTAAHAVTLAQQAVLGQALSLTSIAFLEGPPAALGLLLGIGITGVRADQQAVGRRGGACLPLASAQPHAHSTNLSPVAACVGVSGCVFRDVTQLSMSVAGSLLCGALVFGLIAQASCRTLAVMAGQPAGAALLACPVQLRYSLLLPAADRPSSAHRLRHGAAAADG